MRWGLWILAAQYRESGCGWLPLAAREREAAPTALSAMVEGLAQGWATVTGVARV